MYLFVKIWQQLFFNMEQHDSITGQVWHWLQYPLFNLGNTDFSLWYLLKLFVAVAVLFWLSRRFYHFLVNRVLIRYNDDIGVRQSMATIARYIFFLTGLFVLVHASGIDLGGLALVGGALGVGIGFGLQNITNNFVSGVVILLERPVKVGDRIEVGGVTGDVVKISARATTVVTNDGISVIIPNADLVSGKVINWSLTGKMVRFKIPVPAPYGTDQELVLRMLMEVAAEDPNVNSDPAPSIRLREFGESAIIYELVIWTSKLMHRQGMMKSRINMAVYRKFEANGIRIPMPRLDVQINSGREAT
jgi:small-conductance mechanosensitive channel